jgi:DNA-binding MarR family transcriptional regulator
VTEPRGPISPVLLALRDLWLGGEHYRRTVAKSLRIGGSELSVLGHLHNEGRLTPREIGDRLGITTGSTTAVLDRIERAGYIVRTPNPDDRRSLYLSLTPAGQAAMTWMLEQHQRQIADVLQQFDSNELDRMAKALMAMGQALSTSPMPRPPSRPYVPQPARPTAGRPGTARSASVRPTRPSTGRSAAVQ